MKIIRQLTASEVAPYRKRLAAKQRYVCPICKGSIAHGIHALDHDHSNGMVRGTLCKSCNEGEGRVLAGMKVRTLPTNLACKDKVSWLRNLADYWEYHSNNASGIIHPTWDMRTGKQKSTRRKKPTKKTK